jgi:molybdenum cofactor guanylyltransferase
MRAPTSPTETAVTAAILAGGRARRLGGADKPRLLVGGVAIVERQLAVLRQITDRVMVVGGDPAAFAGLGVDVVPDLVPDGAALGGIYSALAASGRPRTLVVACDMPFLGVPLLRRLLHPFPPQVDVVMPRTHEGLQPLCAVYAARSADAIRRRLEEGRLQLIGLSASVRVEEIGPVELATYDPDGLMFVNVNTPHDYERAKDLVNRVPGNRAAMGDRITEAKT